MGVLLSAITLLATVSTAAQDPAPNSLHGFYRRLTNAEQAIAACTDAGARTAAVDHVLAALKSREASDFATAASELDLAAHIARSEDLAAKPSAPDGWAIAPTHSLMECGSGALQLEFVLEYGEPEARAWSVTLEAPGRGSIQGQITFAPTSNSALWIPDSFDWPAGDYDARLVIADASGTVHTRDIAFSLAQNVDQRLTQLGARVKALPNNPTNLERSQAQALHALLASLAAGSKSAHDYPAARLLAEAENLVESVTRGEKWFTPQRSGEFLLSIPWGSVGIPARIYIPPGVDEDSRPPLVVALHGEGFDQNTWFDGYGGGRIVELCRARGWMLLAPQWTRNYEVSWVDYLIREFAEIYPVDRSAVYLVDHSRGRDSALRAVSDTPQCCRAAELIGARTKKLPSSFGPARPKFLAHRTLYLAAGERDFARGEVEEFYESLVKAGASRTQLMIAPDVEHSLAVGAVLPHAFTWLDAIAPRNELLRRAMFGDEPKGAPDARIDALRYELLSRLRELDRARLQIPSARGSQSLADLALLAELKLAEGDFAAACLALDSARREVPKRPDRPYRDEPDGCGVELGPRLRDDRERSLELTWFRLSGTDDGTGWTPTLQPSHRQKDHPFLDFTNGRPADWSADVAPEASGDVNCKVTLFDGDFRQFEREFVMSFVERRDERLAALAEAVASLPPSAPALERASAQRLLALLQALADGTRVLHDYPGARLLAEAEQVAAAAAKGERWYGPEREGEFFLALPIGSRALATRVFAPPGMSMDKPTPLVIALHGRVFDEDTWFDSYGDGQAKTKCAERGWMLAAPRCAGGEDAETLDAIVNALAERYPINRERVFIVGHSRGGASILEVLSQAPRRYRGVATVGAALEPAAAARLASAPLFLAAGERDFARAGVEAFHKALLASGAKSSALHIYPQAGHWFAVADALPDVFAWFDERNR